MLNKFFFILLFAWATTASAIFTPYYLRASLEDYQIGREWGKQPVTNQMLMKLPPQIARGLAATAAFGGATAFYLGEFNGHYIMATNHHVMPMESLCNSRSAHFPVLGMRFACEKFYGHWTAIDLAIFSIRVTTPAQAQALRSVAKNFQFRAPLQTGQMLMTAGFGVHSNPQRQLMVNFDSDCAVYSRMNDFRFIADPDRLNPADYMTWSFATGCDVSHGDSGSAMIDRQSGDPIGIIWTTATNKPDRIRNSQYLAQAREQGHEDVWQWLSYAVPAASIKAYLEDFLAKSRFNDPDVPQTLQAILNN